MPANTSKGLPYPLPTEPVAEGAQAIRNLADALNLKGSFLIEDKLLAATGAFDFTAIPALYTSLRIVFLLRSARAGTNLDSAQLRFNGDAAANYDYQLFQGYGAAPSASEALGVTNVQFCSPPAATAPGGFFAAGEIVIPNYRSTVASKSLTAAIVSHFSSAGSSRGLVQFNGGIWHPPTPVAINRIALTTANNDNYVAGSRATLYGLA